MTHDLAAPPTTTLRRSARKGPAALAGALAAVAALAVSELASGLLPGASSLVEGVGSRVIDGVPPPVKDLAIAWFGTNDKAALVIGIVLVALGAGAWLGTVARRRFGRAIAGFLAFGVVGFGAAVVEVDGVGPVLAAGAVALVAAGAGLGALWWLLGRAPAEPTGLEVPAEPAALADPASGPRGDRRAFLQAALAVSAAALVSAAAGRYLLQRAGAAAARDAVALPPPAAPLSAPPDAASLDVDGVSQLFTPNDAFYRIDTALSVPQVVPETWRLRITGLVEQEVELSYDDLLAMPLVERDITIACVSNQVGGDLVGNARWTGVPLRDLLERAGVAADAEQVVGRSVDGFTAGFPVGAVTDGREPIVAVGMNGQPLPLEHGFPARLVVPGLYGYVSATKWLAEIELATWDFRAYWVPRGWAREGPIKTQSRIDVPRGDGAVTAGVVPVAGVAWAPTRGIARVEVRVDDGDWVEARLAEAVNADTWRQWVYAWEAEPGRHRVTVRATDGDGDTQPEERTPPVPDGAQGWHTVDVEVV